MLLVLGLLLAAGCQSTATFAPSITPNPTSVSLPPPSETAIPLAALVNGEAITLEEYEMEWLRYQDAHGTDLATDQEASEIVIRTLIEQVLLMQGARSIGMIPEEDDLAAELDQLIADMGGTESYRSWLEENHFTAASFEQALMNEMLATRMIDSILSNVPLTELHANARHILVATQAEAEELRQEILAGADFAELAVLYSMDLSTRPAGGDLGWLPRGTLTMPSIEEALFKLQPGEISDVLASKLGYHIVQLVGLEDRALSYDVLITRQQQAVENWINDKWDQADIEIFVTP